MWDIMREGGHCVIQQIPLPSLRHVPRLLLVQVVGQQSPVRCVERSRLKRDGAKPDRRILYSYYFKSAKELLETDDDARCVVGLLLFISAMIATESSAPCGGGVVVVRSTPDRH